MSNQETIKQINEAMKKIRNDYSELLNGINEQTVILAKLKNAMNSNSYEESAGLVVDLWESCEQVSK